MYNRLKSALHNKVHGAKISRQLKQASVEGDNSFEDECETSSASGSESEYEPSSPVEPGGFGVEVSVGSIVDLRNSPFYFYVCIGNEGELTRRKKRRGIQSSGVLHSRSPILDQGRSSFVLPLSGLTKPELTVRFSRSMIVGADSFLGECHFKINLKTSLDGMEEFRVSRLIGGGNAVLSCRWRVVPFTGDMMVRSNILPNESLVTDADKLNALVDSVRKCLLTLSDEDDERRGQIKWIVSLCQMIETEELNYLLLRIPLGDLLKAVPSIFQQIEQKLMDTKLDVLVRSRIVKAVQMTEDTLSESIVANVITSCPDDQMGELKHNLNGGGDKHTLSSLIFSTVQSDLLREQIILKFQQAAVDAPKIHVLSEIDQVVHSPFGSIKAWPEGPIPGYRQLFSALSREVTFVSNKPLSFESWTHKLIRDLGLEDAPLLVGAKSDLYAIRGGLSRLQTKVEGTKYSNWSMYRRLFPEGRFVWFGESVDFARTLMQDENGKGTSQRFGVGKIVLAIVLGEEESGRVGPRILEPGVVVCGNFIQAAIACINEGILTEDKIIRDLVVDFSKLLSQLEIECLRKKKRHRQLLREGVAELKMDLDRLKQRIENPKEEDTTTKEDLVDSIVLTPIEALSPTLTNHSPTPDADDPSIVDGAIEGERFVLSGL